MAINAQTLRIIAEDAQIKEQQTYEDFLTAKAILKNEKKTAIACKAWQKATTNFYEARKVLVEQHKADNSTYIEINTKNAEEKNVFKQQFNKISQSTLHKNDMAVGVAISFVITAAAIAAIATAMIFCPPAGLTALALGLTFGVLGGAGSLSLLGIVYFSIRLHIAKFLVNIHKKHLYNNCYEFKISKELFNRARRYIIADTFLAPWTLKHKKVEVSPWTLKHKKVPPLLPPVGPFASR